MDQFVDEGIRFPATEQIGRSEGRFAHVAVLKLTDEEGKHHIHGAVGHDGRYEVLAAKAAEHVHAGGLRLQAGFMANARGRDPMRHIIGAEAHRPLESTNHSKILSIVLLSVSPCGNGLHHTQRVSSSG
ncbi:MAG: hypothetical protein J7485_11475 [Sphingobium sp.]|nr:hypothetical protein [Sphingobium sp.]